MKRKLILNWRPEKRLTRAFLAQVRQGIDRFQHWLDFYSGLRWALIAGLSLVTLTGAGWLIKDLSRNGFFFLLTQPDLCFSLPGVSLIAELVSWENLLLLIAGLWLIELLVKKRLSDDQRDQP